ncbi:MAG: hypothetical protein HYY18_15560 [Planctomycetes bacterium]|nr:hypothetical protein [Planctomycetota bacterium]
MEIRYAPQVLDEAVTRELLRRAGAGDPSWTGDFHVLTDAFYALPEVEREAQFQAAHALFFRKLGLGKPLEKVLAEFPRLDSKVADLVVDRALTPSEEEADLMVGGDARRNVRIRLRIVRFDDLAALEGFYRHELVHVTDMLNPEFDYKPIARIAARPAEENLVRARLRLLWNLLIGGRVAQSGKAGAATLEEWKNVAERVYPGLTPEARESIVSKLWGGAAVAWPALVEFSRVPGKLLAFAGISVDASSRGPGSLCPLCSFPTFSWAGDIGDLPRAVLAALRTDFPGWTPENGACRQCIDGYELRIRFAPRVAPTNIR